MSGTAAGPSSTVPEEQGDTASKQEALRVLTRILAGMLDMPVAMLMHRDERGGWSRTVFGPLATDVDLSDTVCGRPPDKEGVEVVAAGVGPMPRRMPDIGADPACFYAAAPVIDPNGTVIGAVCVLDRRPRRLGAGQVAKLADIALLAASTLASLDASRTRHQETEQDRRCRWGAGPDGTIDEVVEPLRRAFALRGQRTDCDSLRSVLHPDERDEVVARWNTATRTGTAYDIEHRIRTTDGSYRWFHVHASPRLGADGQVVRWCGMAIDIHDRRLDQMRIAHLAYHDELTGLSNRTHFRMMLEQRLAEAGRGRPFALLRLELYDFRAMNDTFGHAVGDRLLAQVAIRIGACVRQTDLLAHGGGDEFLILLGDVAQPEEVGRLTDRILRTLTAPIRVDGSVLSVAAAIGITLCPTDGSESNKLLQNADLALMRAKQAGRGGCCFFAGEMDERLRLRQALKVDLSDALDRGQFALNYQPVIDIRTGTVRGFEALLRWHHPSRGLVSPADFIPEAESNGMIVPIGQWVLEQACRDAMCWPDALNVAVNLSAAQFRQRGLVQTVQNALSASGLPARRLVLEITESLQLLDDEHNLGMLNQLRALGTRIALDDFGTGYASLAYLQRFAFDSIKVERTFVARIREGEGARTILRAVLRLAQALGVVCIAEGVETRDELEFLRHERCDAVQGYFFSRPVAADAVADTLAMLQAGRLAEIWSVTAAT